MTRNKNDFSPAAIILAFGLAIGFMIWAGSAKGEEAPSEPSCISSAMLVEELHTVPLIFNLGPEDTEKVRANYKKITGVEIGPSDHILVFAEDEENETPAMVLFFNADCLVGYGHTSLGSFKAVLYSDSL